jgi:hypothetical protein
LFGNAVALNDTLILVGAIGENNGGPFQIHYPGATYSFSLDAALPVTLTNFKAQKLENEVQLIWTTTEETNSSHFEIQRSADGHSWVTIEHVKAANEGSVTAQYVASDKWPLAGQNLYRLKMVDTDGSFAYSKIQTLIFDGAQFASFYPNPVVDRIHIGEVVLKNAISVKLLNQNGQAIFETSNPTASIRTGHLKAGIYVLQVISKDGSILNRQVAIAK